MISKRKLAPLLTALTTTLSLIWLSGAAQAAPLPVVGAENFYADVVAQLGGAHVAASSILSNPEQDPHTFEASPKTARLLSTARLVVYNGAAYDPWMDKLLAASKSPQREAIVAAELVGAKAGDNPHLWYAPKTMPAVASAVTRSLTRVDPANRADYEQRLAQFNASLEPLQAKIAAIKAKYAGTPVTATEPVFAYMAQALGLVMKNESFQLAVMNESEPSASDLAAFEDSIKAHQVRVLLYNSQTSDQMTRRLLGLAHRYQLAVVPVTETAPPGLTYQTWMLRQLDALETALAAKP